MTKNQSFYVFISKDTNTLNRRGGGGQEMGMGAEEKEQRKV